MPVRGGAGHLVQLARDFGYPLEFDDGRKKKYRTLPQRPVKVTNPAVRYLESRGISRAVTERYRITTQRGHDNILVFPFYDGDGVMQFVKYRKTDFFFVKGRDRNKEWSEKDTMPILFGMDRCEGKDRLVITEGQIDSLSLTEAGIQNAVSVPTGAMGLYVAKRLGVDQRLCGDHRLRRLRKGQDHVGRCAFPPLTEACEGRAAGGLPR